MPKTDSQPKSRAEARLLSLVDEWITDCDQYLADVEAGHSRIPPIDDDTTKTLSRYLCQIGCKPDAQSVFERINDIVNQFTDRCLSDSAHRGDRIDSMGAFPPPFDDPEQQRKASDDRQRDIAYTVRSLADFLRRLRCDIAPDPAPAELEGEQLPANCISPCGRSAVWNGVQYTFTTKQAQCLAPLREARERGYRDVGQDYALEQADTNQPLLAEVFKDNPAWGTMVIPGRKRGTFRLAD